MKERKFTKDKEWLRRKYWEEELNIRQIAELFGMGKNAVIYWFKKYDIPLRSNSESKIGEKNQNWNGGINYKDGYVEVYQSKGKYKKRANIVMEKHLGRELTSEEFVHHINGIKDDDRIKNLRLFGSNGEHISLHMKGRKYKRNCLSLKLSTWGEVKV